MCTITGTISHGKDNTNKKIGKAHVMKKEAKNNRKEKKEWLAVTKLTNISL